MMGASVTIRIGANIFGMIAAFVLTIGEILLSSGLQRISKYVSHRNLSRGRSINIPRFLRDMKILACFAGAIFIAMEIALSTQQDPEVEGREKKFPCINTVLNQNPIGTAKDNEDIFMSEAIHFSCLKVIKTRVEHTTGSMRLNNGTITCGSEIAYAYVIGSEEEYSEDIHGKCVETCSSATCACIAWVPDSQVVENRGTLYLSHAYSRGNPPGPLMQTEVNSDLSNNLTQLSRIALNLYLEDLNDQSSARRLLLMGIEKSDCPFVYENVKVTKVKLWALLLPAAVWILSLVIYLATFLLRFSFPFDISDPMHWATRTTKDLRYGHGQGPEIEAYLIEESYDRVLVKVFSDDVEKKICSN